MHRPLINTLLDMIEAELRRLGYLGDSSSPITDGPSSFGYGHIGFEQWLGRVFLPHARAALAANELPPVSQVAVAAVRNLDGVDEADTLLSLLRAFDQRINQMGGAGGIARGGRTATQTDDSDTA